MVVHSSSPSLVDVKCLLDGQRRFDVGAIQVPDFAEDLAEIPPLPRLEAECLVESLLRHLALLPQDLREERRAGPNLCVSDLHGLLSKGSSAPTRHRRRLTLLS